MCKDNFSQHGNSEVVTNKYGASVCVIPHHWVGGHFSLGLSRTLSLFWTILTNINRIIEIASSLEKLGQSASSRT